MKRILVVLFLLSWVIFAGMARAESPVLVSHLMSNYNISSDAVTVSYILTIKNVMDVSITSLTLSLVPLFINSNEITVSIESLEPQTDIQIPITITTPTMYDQNSLLQQSLYWSGSYSDNNGNIIQFPVRSVVGGAK